MLFSVVDDRSGVAYQEYRCVYGEDVEAALRFLFNAMAGNPIPQSRNRSFLGSSPKRLEPTFLNGNPGFRNAFLCIGVRDLR